MDERLSLLAARADELTLDQLQEFEQVLVGELEAAAEARDVAEVREVGDTLEVMRAESRARRAIRDSEDVEIRETLARYVPAVSDAITAAVSSSASSSQSLPSIAAMKARLREPARASRPRPGSSSPSLFRSPAGLALPDTAAVGRALFDRLHASSGRSGRFEVARAEWSLPEDRTLGQDAILNSERVAMFASAESLVAAGGLCAPPAGYYEQQVFSVGDRPIRASLPIFGADRGGIRFIRPPTFSDAGGDSVGHVTEAEDAAATPKTCLTVSCGTVEEVLVNAVYRCLRFGNFDARAHGERVDAFVTLAISQHARLAESNLWESMCDASTAVTAAENLSAWRDLYASVARAGAAMRSRHRMRPEQTLRLLAPFWVADLLSVDLARQMPGDSTQAVSRATFESWLRQINVAVSWTLEGGTDAPTQVFGTQGVGPLDGWPDTVEVLLFPEGAFLYLDGGTLDLGIVRDSDLNAANQFDIFSETFENVAFMGPESYCLTMDLCPSGLSAGQDDSPLNCAVGTVS